VRPLHGLKRGYVTDGFLLYATPWGHYGLFGCLASPSGDACIYPIILLYFSKRTHLYLRVSPRIDSVRFTLVLVSSPCKVKALQLNSEASVTSSTVPVDSFDEETFHQYLIRFIVTVSMRKRFLLGFTGIDILRAIPVVRWECSQ